MGCLAEHEPLDPEYSILKQRLARRIRHDGGTDADLADMDLVDITKVDLLADRNSPMPTSLEAAEARACSYSAAASRIF